LQSLNANGTEWRMFGFYKAHYQSYRSSLFNPDNRSVDLLNYKNSHYSFSQYLNVQKDFLYLQWQFDVKANVEYSNNWQSKLKVKQCFFQRDLWGNWILAAGRIIQRWGTGYAFNPTDVVAPNKELSDLNNSEKRAVGNDMIKLEYFGESYSFGLCYLTKIIIGPDLSAQGSKLACRFYKNLWDIDLSFISLYNKRETPIWGLNFSYVFGTRLEVHGEASLQKGSYLAYHKMLRHGNVFYLTNPFVKNRNADNKQYCQFLIGFQYTLPANILWIAEYFHQDQGYSINEWGRLMEYMKFLNRELTTSNHK